MSYTGPGILDVVLGSSWAGSYPVAAPLGAGDLLSLYLIADGVYTESGTTAANDSTNRLKTVHDLMLSVYPPYVSGSKRVRVYASKDNEWKLVGTFSQSAFGTTGSPPTYDFLDVFSGSAYGYPDNAEEFFYTSLSPWSISFNEGVFTSLTNGTSGPWVVASLVGGTEPARFDMTGSGSQAIDIELFNAGVASTDYTVTLSDYGGIFTVTSNGTGTLAAGSSVTVSLSLDGSAIGDGIYDMTVSIGGSPALENAGYSYTFKVHKNTVPVFRYNGITGSNALKTASGAPIASNRLSVTGITLVMVCRLNPKFTGIWGNNARLFCQQYSHQMRLPNMAVPSVDAWNPSYDAPGDWIVPSNAPDWNDMDWHVVIVSTRVSTVGDETYGDVPAHWEVMVDKEVVSYGIDSPPRGWNGNSVESIGTSQDSFGLYAALDVSYVMILDAALESNISGDGTSDLWDLTDLIRFGGKSAVESYSVNKFSNTASLNGLSVSIMHGWSNDSSSGGTQAPFSGSIDLVAGGSYTLQYDLGLVGVLPWSVPGGPPDATVDEINFTISGFNSKVGPLVLVPFFDQVTSSTLAASKVLDIVPSSVASLLLIGGTVDINGTPRADTKIYIINVSAGDILESVQTTDVDGAWSYLATNGDSYAIFPSDVVGSTKRTDYGLPSLTVE